MEKQNTEWKESWQNEHIACICGFANAQGGVLEIGRNDQGLVVGLPNIKQLLEDLPNKIRSSTGVLADIDLQTENNQHFLRITVQPYPSPLSMIAQSKKYNLYPLS